jgi:hypothetical protein
MGVWKRIKDATVTTMVSKALAYSLVIYAGGLVAAPQMCIGADCRAAWPAAGSTYTAGNGLTLTGTTLSINTTQAQSRVSGTCAVGSSIRTIAADGTVTCETDDTTGGYTIGNGLTLTGSTLTTNTAQTQARVSGTCAAGSSIRSIAANGAVACETDDTAAGVGGGGSTGYIPYWTAATTLANGQLYQDGTNVVVGGLNSLGYKLNVSGNLGVTGNATVGGKVYSTATSGVDPLNTLATKGYVDGLVGSGRAAAWLWWEGGLKASNGISSAVDSGNQVVVNFSVPRADANYAVICNGSLSGSNSPSASELSIYAYSRTVNGFLVEGAIAPGSDNIISMDCVVYD